MICLALNYIRRMHLRIPDAAKVEHRTEDCQRCACVSIAVNRLYVGMVLACHWLGEVDKLYVKSAD